MDTSPAAARVRLEISDERVRLAPDDGAAAIDLPVGTARLGRAGRLRRDPPGDDEIEAAIATVEDALMPALRRLPAHADWHTADPTARALATALGAAVPGAIAIDAVEALFNDMARASALGGWGGGVRLDAAQAAYLLILRECLHHAGVTRLRIE